MKKMHRHMELILLILTLLYIPWIDLWSARHSATFTQTYDQYYPPIYFNLLVLVLLTTLASYIQFSLFRALAFASFVFCFLSMIHWDVLRWILPIAVFFIMLFVKGNIKMITGAVLMFFLGATFWGIQATGPVFYEVNDVLSFEYGIPHFFSNWWLLLIGLILYPILSKDKEATKKKVPTRLREPQAQPVAQPKQDIVKTKPTLQPKKAFDVTPAPTKSTIVRTEPKPKPELKIVRDKPKKKPKQESDTKPKNLF